MPGLKHRLYVLVSLSPFLNSTSSGSLTPWRSRTTLTCLNFASFLLSIQQIRASPAMSAKVSFHCNSSHRVACQYRGPGSTMLRFSQARAACSTPELEEAEAPRLRGEKSFLRGILSWLSEKGQMDAEWQTQLMSAILPLLQVLDWNPSFPGKLSWTSRPEGLYNEPPNILTVSITPLAITSAQHAIP